MITSNHVSSFHRDCSGSACGDFQHHRKWPWSLEILTNLARKSSFFPVSANTAKINILMQSFSGRKHSKAFYPTNTRALLIQKRMQLKKKVRFEQTNFRNESTVISDYKINKNFIKKRRKNRGGKNEEKEKEAIIRKLILFLFLFYQCSFSAVLHPHLFPVKSNFRPNTPFVFFVLLHSDSKHFENWTKIYHELSE